jgi:O-antigen ligase/tetratricopeptide (TPR) repeat protein
MASITLPAEADHQRQGAGFRRLASRLLSGVMEAGVLALVCLSPWAFGAVEPEHEFLVDLGIALLMPLWGVRLLIDGRLSWSKCPVAFSLAASVLLGVWQLTPLPRGLLGRISPVTARMYDRLLPAEPEVLPFGEPSGASLPPAGSTLSFYPGSTRQELARYLAILLLFVLVRNNIASPASLRRFGGAAFVNGSLLALFGLVQAFSADPETIYWTYPAPGATGLFGPFINRNHFAFYMNVCVGLGAGLLLSRYTGRSRMQGVGDATPAGARVSLDRRLDPAVVGMIFALALMISSMVYSLSRGGFLALLGGSAFGLAIGLPRARWSAQGRIVLMTLVTALCLLAWFGYDRVVTRLGSFQDELKNRGGRLAFWSRALPLVKDYPIWGAGFGTYQFVEVLHRSDASHTDLLVDHAHNDYLEALVEGGLILFLSVMAAVVLIFRLGLRGIRCHQDQPLGGLLLGAMVAFTTVVIHSFSDFGMHIPANAAVVTVLCAQLCAGGRKRVGAAAEPAAGREPGDSDWYVLRFRGVAPVLGAVTAVTLGLVLACEGRRAHRAQQLRLTAFDVEASNAPTSHEQAFAALEAATRLVPEYARLHSEFAHAHLNVLQQQMEELAERRPRTAGAERGSVMAQDGSGQTDQDQLTRRHLVPALRHFLQSRDACPLRSAAHMDIAEYVDKFEKAEPRETYLERAKLLSPDDPELWERCGTLELLDGRPDQAWVSWRRSLELSDSHLPEILDRSARLLAPDDLLRKVLPNRPDVLLKAALHLYPQVGEGRRCFLGQALAILEKQPVALGAAELHVKGSIHRALGHPAEALAAYRAALDREPLQLAWRHELAELLYEQGQFRESFQELLKVQMLQPENNQVRALMDAVKRKIAEGS